MALATAGPYKPPPEAKPLGWRPEDPEERAAYERYLNGEEEPLFSAEALAEAAKSGVGGSAASVVVAGSADEDCPAAQAA